MKSLWPNKGMKKRPIKHNLEKGLLLGPYLIKDKDYIFQKKWSMEKENWLKILNQLEKASNTVENNEKKQELQKKIQLVEEVLEK